MPPPACLIALSSASPAVLSRSVRRIRPGKQVSAARTIMPRAAASCDGAPKTNGRPSGLPSSSSELLLREEDELAAGHRIQHVDVRLADALVLPVQRLLRLAEVGDVRGREHPQVLLPAGYADRSSYASRACRQASRRVARRASAEPLHHVEVRAQPLVVAVALAEPAADELGARDPRALGLDGVDVDDHDVLDLTGRASLHAEDREPLGRVVEEPVVALLALHQLRVLAPLLQRRDAHLAEHADEVGEEPDGLLELFVGDDRHAVESGQVGLLVEPEPPRPPRELRPVHVVVVEEELPGVDVGHVLAGHDQREGHVPQPVAALVGVVLGRVQSLGEPPVDAQVALETPAQRVRVLAMEAGADVLPPGGDEDVAGEVEDGEREVERLGEALAEALDAVEIDQTRELVPLGLHRALPFASAAALPRAMPCVPRTLLLRYPARPCRERAPARARARGPSLRCRPAR